MHFHSDCAQRQARTLAEGERRRSEIRGCCKALAHEIGRARGEGAQAKCHICRQRFNYTLQTHDMSKYYTSYRLCHLLKVSSRRAPREPRASRSLCRFSLLFLRGAPPGGRASCASRDFWEFAKMKRRVTESRAASKNFLPEQIFLIAPFSSIFLRRAGFVTFNFRVSSSERRSFILILRSKNTASDDVNEKSIRRQSASGANIDKS